MNKNDNVNENVNVNVNGINKSEIAGRACSYRNGKIIDGQEGKLIVFKGYHKIKKLKHIDGEEYFSSFAKKMSWNVVYDFDWCEKVSEIYDRNCFETVDEKNKIGVLKDEAKSYGEDKGSNIVVWAAWKKFEDFSEFDIEAGLKFFDGDEKEKYENGFKTMSEDGRICWIAYVGGNCFVRGIYSGVCENVDEFMRTDFELSRGLENNDFGKKEIGWKSICLHDFGDREFDCKISKIGASKCSVLQELKRYRGDIKRNFDRLCSCGWYTSGIHSEGDYYCDRVQFEKLLMGGELGVLKGEVVKLGSRENDWKFRVWHDVSGILGGVKKYGEYCGGNCNGEWCKSKWLDEHKGYLWLDEDEMEGWIGMIRGLKEMEKLVEKE